MKLKLLKKIALFLIIGGAISTASAQVYSKIGENPSTLNNKAVLELESKSKGFLPPRMTKDKRDGISSPIPIGLQVWCTNCNILTNPPSGELSVYIGTGWAPFAMLKASRLSTGRRTDPNKPVRISATSAIIKGTLLSTSGVPPTETGVVYREITGNDFATLPVLDNSGTATAPNYKIATARPVTTEGGIISVTIPDFSSTAIPKRPFSFRTYAKDPSGIVVYGNPVIFNLAPPVISDPVVTNGNTLFPVFGGTLTAIAGTLAGTITEYGYCSSTTNSSPTIADNKVTLSGVAALAALDTKLNAESFTADPTVDLAVKDYKVTASGLTYFKYYAIANGETIYSNVVNFTPPNPVTGGSAEATVASVGTISKPLKIGDVSGSTITVLFNVTKAGTYKFEPTLTGGATKGITMPVVSGSFANIGNNQPVIFTFSGTPTGSLEGNTFSITKAGTLSTGKIEPADMKGALASCDALHETKVVDVTSSTSKVWMDRNLGASRQANSSTDFESFGCLYQWGRGNDDHASINWTSATAGTPVNSTTPVQATTNPPGNALFITGNNEWLSATNTNWQGADGGINNPCPSDYRVPTYAEFANEKAAYGITNAAKAYDSALKFPKNRIRDYNTGDVSDSRAFYWTSTISTEYNTTSSDFTFDDAEVPADDVNSHAYGFGVRCIKEIVRNPVSGGDAVATVTSVEKLVAKTPFKIGEAGSGTIKVNFNVTKAGSYGSFTVTGSTGATTGLSIAALPAGSFAIGNQSLTFTVSGTPDTSLEGNSFSISRIATPLSTGKIEPEDMKGGTALCDPLHQTKVEEVLSTTGKIWMDRNLGASANAKSSAYGEYAVYNTFGCLYQWGRGNDGHASIRWGQTDSGNATGFPINGATGELSVSDNPGHSSFILNPIRSRDWRSPKNDALWQGVDGVNNPCPKGYRVPSLTELNAEFAEYGITDNRKGYDTVLGFPPAGMRHTYDATFDAVYMVVHLWTSTVNGDNAYYRTGTGFSSDYRGEARSVRCIKDIKELPVSGDGTAEVTVTSVEKLVAAPPLKIGVAGKGTIKVNFNVTKAGSYDSFTVTGSTGATTGLSIAALPAGNFSIGNQSLTFTVSGTPGTSLEGNSFSISRIATLLRTGKIKPGDMKGANATCDALHETKVVDVTSLTAKVWMDRNLGASRTAISSDDYQSYGCLYQWGRGNDGHASIKWTSATAGTPVSGITSTQATTNPPGNALFIIGNNEWRSTTNTNWEGADGGINNPCPSGYRVPTYAEFANEKATYGITNTAKAYESVLKFPKNRIREFSAGDIIDSRAFYWTSTIGKDAYASSDFTFNDTEAPADDANAHAYGFGVRCIKGSKDLVSGGGTAEATVTSIDKLEATPPLKIGVASSGTIKVHFNVTKAGSYDSFVPSITLGATRGLNISTVPAGNFAVGNQTLEFKVSGTPSTSLEGNIFNVPRIGMLSTGAISDTDEKWKAICDGTQPTPVVEIRSSVTGRIWMDRNLGASHRATSANRDFTAYGCLYQWGRGNDGHASINWATNIAFLLGQGITGTTKELSGTDSPPTDKFITPWNDDSSEYDWRYPQNPRLWQGADGGINNPCPANYRVPTIEEFEAENIPDDKEGKFSSDLKLVGLGFRLFGIEDHGTISEEKQPSFWSSTVGDSTNGKGFKIKKAYRYLTTNNNQAIANAYGCSVRCIKDGPITVAVAVATLGTIEPISKSLKIGEASTSTIRVHFNVTRAGSYESFVPSDASGATTGLSMATVPAGNFVVGDNVLTFTITGTPGTSLEGNTFDVPRIGTLNTEEIEPGDMKGALASCDPLHQTKVVEVTSKTGKIWMDRNLGASESTKIISDMSGEGIYQTFGCLYQWGRSNDGHASMNWHNINGIASGDPVNGTTAELSSSDNPGTAKFITNLTGSGDWRSSQKDGLWQGADGVNNPCPTGYRIPSLAELNEEFTKYRITDRLTAYKSELGFPAAGMRFGTYGNKDDIWVVAYLWSSTTDGDKAKYYRVGPDDRGLSSGPYSSSRGDAYSVRCIKDKNTPVSDDTAVAKVTFVAKLAGTPLRIGVAGSGTIKVHFKVTKAGSYNSFVPSAALGATTGLSMATVPGGYWGVGNQTLEFTVSGTPKTSLDGNTFNVPGIGILSTGAILDISEVGNFKAYCDGDPAHATAVIEIKSSRTGRIWMDRNLGASRRATDKFNPNQGDYPSYGCLYQWGRGNDGHASINWATGIANEPAQGITGTTGQLSGTDTPGNLFIVTYFDDSSHLDWRLPQKPSLWQGVNGANNPCPAGYRIPTIGEFEAEQIPGDRKGALLSELKLVGAGFRLFTIKSQKPGFINAESRPSFWTSTVVHTTNGAGYPITEARRYYKDDNGDIDKNPFANAYGLSVRCIKD